MDHEISLAKHFASELYEKRVSFSEEAESAMSRAFSHATMFDIETGGLQPTSPIYEMGFQHGINNPTYVHSFVKPTDLSGTRSGDISGFTDALLEGREASSPGIRSQIEASTLSQQQAALRAHSELSGRDIWVQNLSFERRFLSARVSKPTFNAWAKRSLLESFSPGGGIYTTTPGVKRAIVEAAGARGKMAPLDTYLSKWSNVFTEIDKTLQAPRQQGITRAFDMMDLTRSVFAMAQEQGHMPKTGELFAGTSIDALSRALYGVEELHTALGDTALQGELTRFLYGTGKMMQSGEELNQRQLNFFDRIGKAQVVQKQRNLTKNIITTFRDQQRFLGEQERGNYVPSLLEGSRIDHATKRYKSDLQVLQSDGSYQTETFTRVGRDYDKARYSTDINEVVNSWKAKNESQWGINLDYDKAMQDAGDYIQPYKDRLSELNGNRLAALDATEDVFHSLHSKLDTTVKEAYSGKGIKSGRGWRMGLGVAAGVAIYGWLFSGKDDEANYIEGMRHGGFAGTNRRYQTDFGSGYQGQKEYGEYNKDWDGKWTLYKVGDPLKLMIVGAPNDEAKAWMDGYIAYQKQQRAAAISTMHNIQMEPYEGLSSSYEGPVASIALEDLEVEDADTVRATVDGKEITLRLAGIDAPEIQHGDNYASNKVFQNQPFGQEATSMLKELLAQQEQVTAVFDPRGDGTYGRTPALLFGDNGLNINLALVRSGAAASLPFGLVRDRLFDTKEFNQAQEEAVEESLGMWAHPGWQAANEVQKGSKRRVTHNTFTDLGKLFGNFKAASIVQRLRNPNAEFSEMTAAGGRDDLNIQEGLQHGWGKANREANIGDFGSGYRIDKVIETMRKNTRVHKRLVAGQQQANTYSRTIMDPQSWTKHHIGG